MILRNLTPHDVVILTEQGPLRLAPEPPGARCEEHHAAAGTLSVLGHQVPVSTIAYGTPVGLPDAEEGTLLVVSKIIVDAAPDRTDLVIPDQVIRDEHGQILGCRGLAWARR